MLLLIILLSSYSIDHFPMHKSYFLENYCNIRAAIIPILTKIVILHGHGRVIIVWGGGGEFATLNLRFISVTSHMHVTQFMMAAIILGNSPVPLPKVCVNDDNCNIGNKINISTWPLNCNYGPNPYRTITQGMR